MSTSRKNAGSRHLNEGKLKRKLFDFITDVQHFINTMMLMHFSKQAFVIAEKESLPENTQEHVRGSNPRTTLGGDDFTRVAA